MLLLLACTGKDDSSENGGDNGGDNGTDDTQVDTAECVEDDDCEAGRICEDDACIAGDRNNSVDEAESILWSEPVNGVINPDDDVDYYVFTAEGGEYVRIATEVDKGFDTVVTLRDAAGKVVTSANAFATETAVGGVDAVAFAYLDGAGTYSISVEDIGTATGQGGYGVDAYTYVLELSEWADTTFEDDALDDPSAIISLADERIWSSVGVLVDAPGDSDWIEVSFPLDGQNLFVDGNEDLTGSDLSPLVRLYDAAGNLVGERGGVGPEDYLLAPHLPAGTYVVELTDAGGDGSPNHWAFVHLISRPDTDGIEFLDEAEPNDDAASANGLTLTAYENGSGLAYSQTFGIGWADVAGDQDWFAIETPYDDGGLVVCLVSSWWGSLLSPSIGVYSADGELLAEEAGTTGYPTAKIEDLTVPAGTYFLRVGAPKDSAYGVGAWYRFYWYTASFPIATYAEGGYACP